MLDKLLAKIQKTPDCWVWTGHVHKGDGYGRVYTGRKGWDEMAHRVVYETLTGESIPDYMTVDHLCLNKRCVNPAHLEIVTRAENTRRARLGMYRSDYCRRGHILEDVNWKDQRRACRVCHRAANRKTA